MQGRTVGAASSPVCSSYVRVSGVCGVCGPRFHLCRAPSRSAASSPAARIALRSASQHRGGIGARRVGHPAAFASASTASISLGWLSLSASPLASRGTDTASHCVVSSRACRSSTRMAAAPLEAAFSAAAAGSQSPTAITAAGGSAV
eukprot:6213495-Pleurochrysis_carterae.AAC.2